MLNVIIISRTLQYPQIHNKCCFYKDNKRKKVDAMAIKLPNKALCSENIEQLRRNPFLELQPRSRRIWTELRLLTDDIDDISRIAVSITKD